MPRSCLFTGRDVNTVGQEGQQPIGLQLLFALHIVEKLKDKRYQ